MTGDSGWKHVLEELLAKYPFLKSHPHLKFIRGAGVAAHHARAHASLETAH